MCESYMQQELELEELFNNQLTKLEEQNVKTDNELKASKGDDLLKVSHFSLLKFNAREVPRLPGCWNYLGVLLINSFFRAESFKQIIKLLSKCCSWYQNKELFS